MNDVWKWAEIHWVACVELVVHIVFSIIFHYVELTNDLAISIVGLLAAKDVTYVSLNCIFILLFSGIPVSIGSVQWFLWMIWSAGCLFVFRMGLGVTAVGPSYLVSVSSCALHSFMILSCTSKCGV